MKPRHAAALAFVPVLSVLADITCVLVGVVVAVGVGEWLALKHAVVIYILCPAIGLWLRFYLVERLWQRVTAP